MKSIKNLIFNILLSLNKARWKNNKKFKILIQTNSYFNQDLWIKALKSNFKFFTESEFIFPKTKLSTIKLLRMADSCFLWSLSNFVDLTQSNLKLIYFGIVGLEFLKNKKIPTNIKIFNPSGFSSEAIAEFVLTMCLLVNRDLHLPILSKSKKKWVQDNLLKNQYVPLKYKKIGIIGYGQNGKAIARYFKSIGCHVNALDIRDFKDDVVDCFYLNKDLDVFLSNSDIVVLIPSLNKTTYNLVDRFFINKLKEGSILINVSRGNIINDKDLKKTINTKKIKYVILDVFNKEPLPFLDWKWRNKKVIITPHIAGNINYFVDEIMLDFIDKLNKFLVL